MAGTEFEQYLQEEVNKGKGVYVPIKAGVLERLLVKKMACTKLHPNPEDEFCFPDIGPNLGIISDYVKKFNDNIAKDLPIMDEPVIIQKIRPDGYMLLNGHHRWAAALRLGINKIPVSVVNAVFDGDIRKMLEAAKHDRRVTMDLDEVVFAEPGADAEKPPAFWHFILRRKHIRLGVPALISYLRKSGYDVWVYSSDYYSIDDIKRFFGLYGVTVDGIITGMKKRKKTEELIANKYKMTVNIDREVVIVTHSQSKDFEEKEIKCLASEWSKEVMSAVDGIATDEE